MTKAHAEQWQPTLQALATFDRNASLGGRTRARRDNDSLGLSFENLIDGDLIVAEDLNVEPRIDLAQPLDKVVRERVVVIDDEDHGEGYRIQDAGLCWVILLSVAVMY